MFQCLNPSVPHRAHVDHAGAAAGAYVTRTLATTAAHEMSPVCAVVGGLLAQDILKALAAREPPIANFFTFDGNLGGGTVVRMAMP